MPSDNQSELASDEEVKQSSILPRKRPANSSASIDSSSDFANQIDQNEADQPLMSSTPTYLQDTVELKHDDQSSIGGQLIQQQPDHQQKKRDAKAQEKEESKTARQSVAEKGKLCEVDEN